MNTTPSFNGWNAVILHRTDEGIERLVRQLTRLGLNARVQWQPLALERFPQKLANFSIKKTRQNKGVEGFCDSMKSQNALEAAPPDLVLVDADQGWNGLLPWIGDETPMPLIALLGSEAPGRVAWAMEHGAHALLAKPIAASAVYPCLVMATHLHRQRLASARRVADLEERIRLRPLVHGAVRTIMTARNMDESTAYDLLRATAMRRRMTIEHIAADILAGHNPIPEVG